MPGSGTCATGSLLIGSAAGSSIPTRARQRGCRRSSLVRRSGCGLRAAGDIPFVGGLAGELDADGLAEQADHLRAFLARRFRNNSDDMQLLLNPVGTLTPVFLDELCEAAEDGPVALFFDTYERTSSYLDTWLLALLDGDTAACPRTS